MTKIVYLPLDERPCNYIYPQMLADMTDLTLIVPGKDELGNKKQPAAFQRLDDWTLQKVEDADYLIVSVDMLVYGGIVPSRLHHLSIEECKKRMLLLERIKEKNPRIRIYGFNLVMRTPSYSSSDEEPDYYEQYGRHIFKYGWLTDKAEKDGLSEDEQNELLTVKEDLPDTVLDDFLRRRETNHQINQLSVDLVEKGIIDHLVIPLDDNSHYGYTSREQRKLTFKIEELNLADRVLIYPGADEVGCTLFAKVFSEVMEYTPEVFVRYSSTHGPYIIPKLEDRSLNESIKSQLTSVNAFMADSPEEADFILMVNSPAVGPSGMADGEPFERRHSSYFSEVNTREFMQAIARYIHKGKIVALADVASLNGGDHSLMKLLSKNDLLAGIEAYAGWNTSGNTLGTVIAHAVIRSYYLRRESSNDVIHTKRSREFYYYRLIEDWGYQSLVRQNVCEHDLPGLGGDYFNITAVKKVVEEIVSEKLNQFISWYLSDVDDGTIKVENAFLPWNRMFEVGFQITLHD